MADLAKLADLDKKIDELIKRVNELVEKEQTRLLLEKKFLESIMSSRGLKAIEEKDTAVAKVKALGSIKEFIKLVE